MYVDGKSGTNWTPSRYCMTFCTRGLTLGDGCVHNKPSLSTRVTSSVLNLPIRRGSIIVYFFSFLFRIITLHRLFCNVNICPHEHNFFLLGGWSHNVFLLMPQPSTFLDNNLLSKIKILPLRPKYFTIFSGGIPL